MKIYNDDKIFNLHHDLKNVLAEIRLKRNFDVQKYVQDKINKLNDYMRNYNLKSCVVAVSGGIDSAATYALVHKAMSEANSTIQRIVPIFLPVYKSNGASNQESAKEKAKELVYTFSKDDLIEIDISTAHQKLMGIVNNAMGIKGSDWASGQLVSYLRTPTYYYATSLLTDMGLSPIICGTTNKDEGAYLGYFGKASDGMVDIQMISDIHKSEVYQVSKYLGVPDSIIKAVPTGDMYDNRSDEEVFGATYDFVEIYMNHLKLSQDEKEVFKVGLSEDAKSQFEVLSNNLDKMHRYNKHKYLGASPAVHLDVLASKFDGGWIYNTY